MKTRGAGVPNFKEGLIEIEYPPSQAGHKYVMTYLSSPARWFAPYAHPLRRGAFDVRMMKVCGPFPRVSGFRFQ